MKVQISSFKISWGEEKVDSTETQVDHEITLWNKFEHSQWCGCARLEWFCLMPLGTQAPCLLHKYPRNNTPQTTRKTYKNPDLYTLHSNTFKYLFFMCNLHPSIYSSTSLISDNVETVSSWSDNRRGGLV